jgi:drug/metabolite transporter (DMT)-like permease
LIQPLPQARRGWRDYALLLALACCWSSTYPLTKIGLGSIPPITFISARSLTAALFLLIILRLRGIRMPTDAVAWRLFAFQQTINSTIPFLRRRSLPSSSPGASPGTNRPR